MHSQPAKARHTPFAIPLITSLLASGCSQGLPDAARDEIFQKSKFAEIIQLGLPDEDSREFLKQVCTTKFGMTPLHLNSATKQGNPHLVSYLTQSGFAEIQGAVIRSKYNTEPVKFFFYTDKLQSDPNITDTGDKSGWGGGRYKWNLGRRVLKDVTYANRYNASPNGTPIEMVGITFNYEISWNVAEFSDAGGIHEGKAQAYLDPSDGRWKVDELNLSDNGKDEFLEILNTRFSAYDRNAPSGTDGCEQYKDIVNAQRAHEERKRLAGIPTTIVGRHAFEQAHAVSRSKMLPVELTITDASIVTEEAFAIFFPKERTRHEYFFSQVQRPYVPAGTPDGHVFVGKKFNTIATSDHQQMINEANAAFETWKAKNSQLIADCPNSRTWGCVD